MACLLANQSKAERSPLFFAHALEAAPRKGVLIAAQLDPAEVRKRPPFRLLVRLGVDGRPLHGSLSLKICDAQMYRLLLDTSHPSRLSVHFEGGALRQHLLVFSSQCQLVIVCIVRLAGPVPTSASGSELLSQPRVVMLELDTVGLGLLVQLDDVVVALGQQWVVHHSAHAERL